MLSISPATMPESAFNYESLGDVTNVASAAYSENSGDALQVQAGCCLIVGIHTPACSASMRIDMASMQDTSQP